MIVEINYDLNKPGQNYDDVIAAIKDHSGWCHVMASCWLVTGANITPKGVSDKVRAALDKNDSLFVHQFRKPYCGWLSQSTHDWINKHA